MNDNIINKTIKYLAGVIDYIDEYTPECKEKNFTIKTLNESVFWLTYLTEIFDEE